MSLCLTVLIGLPGSGKTTFAQTLKTHFTNYQGKYYNFIHVCYDELMPYDSNRKFSEDDKSWKDLRDSIVNDIDLLLSCITKGDYRKCPEYYKNQLQFHLLESIKVIIVDDNMYLRSMRRAFYVKAKDFKVSFCQVYFKSTIQNSVEKNLSRTSNEIVPLHIINEMHSKLEEPRSDNKWEKYSLTIDAFNEANELYNEYFKLLNKSLSNPENMNVELFLKEKEKSVTVCMTNILHQCDIALRQIVSSEMQKYISNYKPKQESNSALKKYSKQLSYKKGKVLCDIRSGLINLPQDVLQEIEQKNMVCKLNLKLFLENVFAIE